MRSSGPPLLSLRNVILLGECVFLLIIITWHMCAFLYYLCLVLIVGREEIVTIQSVLRHYDTLNWQTAKLSFLNVTCFKSNN